MSRLLAHPRTEHLIIRFTREYVVEGCRDILEELRRAVGSGRHIDTESLQDDAILQRLEVRLAGPEEAVLQRVVNATGTVLHDGLGGALLSEAAVNAMVQAATCAVNLEYDLVQGDRGRREQAIESLLMDLTGAEAATVVNNDAAAVLLALDTLASGKEVVVSHRALVEVAPAVPMRGVIERSGAVLKEVGGASGTRASDFENAITDRTAVLLKVRAANDRVAGVEGEVSLPELVAIGRRHAIPVVEDLGGGALADLSRYDLPPAPVVAQSIAEGADLVTVCGDEVLGGPQAGLALGRADVVKRMTANPLHRALQCGKLTIAALEATLRLYRESACIALDIPALRALTRPQADIANIAQRALPALAAALGPGFRVSVQDSMSRMGESALRTAEVPTKVIAIEHDFMGPHRIAGRFRQARPPIIGRIADGRFLLDARTILDPLDLVPNWSGELESPRAPGS